MAKAKAAGHRVVLVVATRGELGEPVDGVLDDGEELWQRRVVETHRSAEIVGADRVEFLGYRDSGMMGEPTNDDPASFWQADLDEAAERLEVILRDEAADVFVTYDDHGGYGHPDHIQVHRVGVEAARRAGVPKVYESTMNRDNIRRGMEERQSFVDGNDLGDLRREIDDGKFGSPESIITHAVDVLDFVETKRAAMIAHASQIPADSFFLSMPAEAFAWAFGTEWYIDRAKSRDGGPFLTDLFE